MFLLQNFLMDLVAVTGVNYFLRRRRKWRYLILTATISSVLGLVLLLVVKNYQVYCVLAHFVLNTCMVGVCFGRCSKKEFLENWAVTYLMVILLGGMMEWLNGSGVISQNM
ncbi:MAG: sigma-E processing peptidase SpoIIGA, partial [Lachnospiraceae bacterium]|nr:sigma-E processing peptidase SpoIIGA [Lachnospiraceae bacterium]